MASDRDPIVNDIQTLIKNSFDAKRERDSRNENILKLFSEGFDVAEPNGARKITSQMLYQVMWKSMNLIKPLDFELKGNNKPDWQERVMTYGLSTIADKSDYVRNLRTKQGVYWNSFLFGDGFYMMGTQESEAIPIIYSIIPNSNIYFDQYCTAIRATEGRSATKAFAIFSMDTKVAYQLFPELKRRKIKGQIPREVNRIATVETGRGYLQTWRIQSDITEIGYYYDITDAKRPTFAIVAGNEMEVLRKLKGSEYPFVKDEKPYIPIGQQMCIPSAQGFYNYGIGDLLYRLAIVNRRLLNLAYGHAEDSTYPDTLISVPQGQASQIIQAIQEAKKGRAMGYKPIVPIEYDPAAPNASRLMAQTLTTNPLMNEFLTMRDIISQELRRCGINIDSLDINPQATQYQIEQEEKNRTEWMRNIQEANADEFQFSLEVILDLAKKFIKKKNDTKINIPVPLEIDGTQVKGGDFTLGAWAQELRDGHYWIKVDSRTGAIASDMLKQIRLSRVMPYLQGTPFMVPALKEFAALNGHNIDTSSMQPNQGQMPPAGMQPGAMPPEMEQMMNEQQMLPQ